MQFLDLEPLFIVAAQIIFCTGFCGTHPLLGKFKLCLHDFVLIPEGEEVLLLGSCQSL